MSGEGNTRSVRRALLAGAALVLVCGCVVFSPLLLGRGSLNRYLVAFGLMGFLLGASLLLHGGWDWLTSGRGR
jgi:hypothetical protein